jgi:hypothetical protein
MVYLQTFKFFAAKLNLTIGIAVNSFLGHIARPAITIQSFILFHLSKRRGNDERSTDSSDAKLLLSHQSLIDTTSRR